MLGLWALSFSLSLAVKAQHLIGEVPQVVHEPSYMSLSAASRDPEFVRSVMQLEEVSRRAASAARNAVARLNEACLHEANFRCSENASNPLSNFQGNASRLLPESRHRRDGG